MLVDIPIYALMDIVRANESLIHIARELDAISTDKLKSLDASIVNIQIELILDIVTTINKSLSKCR